MEKCTELKTYRVTMPCPSCGQGEMKATGVVLTVFPPLYVCRCNFCKHEESYEYDQEAQ